MHRNAISTGVLTLLLGISGSLLAASQSFANDVTAPSVANDAPAATVHSAPSRLSSAATRAVRVASALKRRRAAPMVASVIAVPPTPKAPAYVASVDVPGITDNHKKIATNVLGSLPSGCRDNLQNFSVIYKGATRRGLGGKTTIILDGSVPDDEFAALLVHECAHVIHANMPGTASSGDSGYRDGNVVFYNDSAMVAYWNLSWTATGAKKHGAKDADFASGYAKSNQYEDFAEAFALYALQPDAFAARAKNNAVMAAKLAWMQANLPMQYEILGDGSDAGSGAVPWDVTKLAFLLAK
jgi:hypothetical protein